MKNKPQDDDRVISLNAVIDAIEFFQMNPQHFDFVNLIDDIKEIPSAELKWIPVSERLPNRDEYIASNGLFIVSDGNRSYAEYFDIYNSQKYFGEPTIEGFKIDRCVIKWMPLPPCHETGK